MPKERDTKSANPLETIFPVYHFGRRLLRYVLVIAAVRDWVDLYDVYCMTQCLNATREAWRVDGTTAHEAPGRPWPTTGWHRQSITADRRVLLCLGNVLERTLDIVLSQQYQYILQLHIKQSARRYDLYSSHPPYLQREEWACYNLHPELRLFPVILSNHQLAV